MDTSYRDAVNTDGMADDEIEVRLSLFDETYPQALLLCTLTQPAPFSLIQAAFMTTSDPETLKRYMWSREDNGLQPCGRFWKFVAHDGTRFDINMKTWLKKNHSERVKYANTTASEKRTKVKKE